MRCGLSLIVLAIVSLAGILDGATHYTARCIEPDARSLYTRGDERLVDRLEIRPDGQACSIYPAETAWPCCGGVREGENFRFDAVATRSVCHGARERGALSAADVRLGADS